MKVNKSILFIGILLGLIAVFLLNRYIVSLSQNDEAAAATSYSEVVIAAKLIPEHVVITEDMVSLEEVHSDSIHPDALRSLEEVVGGISRAEIISGEQLLSARIVTEDIKPSLSYQVPENMRAMTIPIDQVSGLVNYITVGDRVDILVSYVFEEEDAEGEENTIPYTFTQLQNIEVAALGGLKAPLEEETVNTEQENTITIFVNPQQAEVLAFANVNGTFHLTLRNPVDDEVLDLQHYSIDNFQSFRAR